MLKKPQNLKMSYDLKDYGYGYSTSQPHPIIGANVPPIGGYNGAHQPPNSGYNGAHQLPNSGYNGAHQLPNSGHNGSHQPPNSGQLRLFIGLKIVFSLLQKFKFF